MTLTCARCGKPLDLRDPCPCHLLYGDGIYVLSVTPPVPSSHIPGTPPADYDG